MPTSEISYMSTSEESSLNELRQRRRRSTSAERSFSRVDPETGERISVLISAGEGKSKVRFYRFSSVILIPSRVEYRMAECDLWWQREDFVTFQQTARSELSLLCRIDNIGVREARRRLYQPEFAKYAERRQLHDLTGEHSGLHSFNSISNFLSEDFEDGDEGDDGYDGFIGSPSRQTKNRNNHNNSSSSSSSNNRSGSNRNKQNSDDNSVDSKEMALSLLPMLQQQVFQSAGDLAQLAAAHATAMRDTQDNYISPRDTEELKRALPFLENPSLLLEGDIAEISSTPEGSPQRRFRHWSLHLCVPLKPFTVPLVLEPHHTSHHSLRSRKGSNNSNNGHDNGFLAVMGFCSFALPIVGYLLFNNSKFSIFHAFSSS